ncbi:mitochondrial carrier domain-containing protein [Schizothecium vesticola]|uniref:Mitochondrial carrier domain-containing protein n=1 Tax=Schizothecium vesticola TaxID=314040 RepID=A0AA40F8J7_9PEZI|nr:mitochondrial carrier domain-containing protein [Schizothecium vesticola]
MPPSHPPPALTHATAAAAGTLVSTLLTYPLDLVTTRLKVQRQLPLVPSDPNPSLLSAFRAILHDSDGDPRALYAGLQLDLVKSVVDSFLFFLFYTYLATHATHGKNHPLITGAVAGAATKLVTTPVANVVTRRQLSPTSPTQTSSFWDDLVVLRREGGLWAGYGASAVLAVNPGVTVWLEGVLLRLVGKGRGWKRFLVAAGSKAVATGGMYPLVVGRARVQAGVGAGDGTGEGDGEGEKAGGEGTVQKLARDSIFGTVWRIARTEGWAALYDGMSGELLKGFVGYGLSMVFKDVVHGVLVRVYVALVVFLQRYPGIRARLVKKMRAVREGVSSVGGAGIRGLRATMGSTPVLKSVIGGGEGL